jgi:catechol 2,3-dioxygenase-like lactoylglutathione lyase family enzyme
MIDNARYGHTNLIAHDWRRLARFYEDVFGCTTVGPERDYSGPELEAATRVPGAALAGVHLKFPGFCTGGPTLEIFTYNISEDTGPTAANRFGWGHIAFAVPDVADGRRQVIAAGGEKLGEIETLTTADHKRVTFCYVADPEGNLIELQSWA